MLISLSIFAIFNLIFAVFFIKAILETGKEIDAHNQGKRQNTATLYSIHKRTHRQQVKYAVVFFLNFLGYFLAIAFYFFNEYL